MNKALLTPLNFFIATLLVAVASLGAAYTAQYGFDMKPCKLCLLSRYPYMIMGAISLAGLTMQKNRKIQLIFMVLITLCFATEVAISFNHFGVEQGFIESSEECKIDLAPGVSLTIEELQMQLFANSFKVTCEHASWKILGISVTIWNMLWAALWFMVSLVALYNYNNNSRRA